MAQSFETAVKIEASRLRDLFASRDVSYLSFSIEISGPVDRDELAISFRVGTSSYSDESVKGAKVKEVVDEFFRRKGWKANNDYLALPYMERHTEE